MDGSRWRRRSVELPNTVQPIYFNSTIKNLSSFCQGLLTSIVLSIIWLNCFIDKPCGFEKNNFNLIREDNKLMTFPKYQFKIREDDNIIFDQ